MEPVHTIRLLTPDDADMWAQRRLEALTAHPLLFGAALPADASQLVDFVRTQVGRGDSGVWGAYVADRLDGMVGVYRETGAKARHKAVI